MDRKLLMGLIAAVTAGILGFTRAKNAPPADLRDAVAEDTRAPEMSTEIPEVEKEAASLPAPAPAAAEETPPAVTQAEAPSSAQVQEVAITGRNVTKEYSSIFSEIATGGADRAKSDDITLKRLVACRIIFVTGFMTDALIDSDLLYKAKLGGAIPTYFEEQVRWLRAKGLDAGMVNIQSEAGIAHNARLIAAEIEKSPRPVILLGHSKGGLDILETLLQRPELRPKVRAVITVQSPFLGAPIADYVLERRALAGPASIILKLMGGSMESVRDLSVKSRKAYNAKNADEIAMLTAAIPFISFGSWKKDEKSVMDTILEPCRDLMDKWGMKNDGLVPVNSAMLPGADQIAIEGLDHVATVLEVRTPAFKRLDFVSTLLQMLIARGV